MIHDKVDGKMEKIIKLFLFESPSVPNESKNFKLYIIITRALYVVEYLVKILNFVRHFLNVYRLKSVSTCVKYTLFIQFSLLFRIAPKTMIVIMFN